MLLNLYAVVFRQYQKKYYILHIAFIHFKCGKFKQMFFHLAFYFSLKTQGSL